MDDGDALPSWNDGDARRAIVAFVRRVSDAGSPDRVPPEARVAVFDNDGTLWCEKPLPVQADFMMRRLAEMAARDPSLTARQPWKAVADNDHAWLAEVITKHYRGDDSNLKVMADGLLQAYAGVTIEEFEALATEFLRAARHPGLGRPYVRCVYQPMTELLRYLEANGFACYIVSGGGRDFMRPIAGPCYGVPRERVIGSSVVLRYRDDGDTVTLVHEAELGVLQDGAAKPAGIWTSIGRRPILAGGNSNGDLPMLRFCAHPARPSLALLVEHDDGEREYAYQAGAEQALAHARASGWTVASVRDDWKVVFPV